MVKTQTADIVAEGRRAAVRFAVTIGEVVIEDERVGKYPGVRDHPADTGNTVITRLWREMVAVRVGIIDVVGEPVIAAEEGMLIREPVIDAQVPAVVVVDRGHRGEEVVGRAGTLTRTVGQGVIL